MPRIWRKPIGNFLKFAQVFRKAFRRWGEDGDRAIMRTHAIVGEADIAKKLH